MICTFCGTDDLAYLGVKEEANVFRCASCHIIYRDPVIPHRYLRQYRHPADYHTARQRDVGHVPYMERIDHDYAVGVTRIEKLRKYKPSGRLLDVGASNGAFVKCARDYGYDAHGLEFSEELAGQVTGAGVVDDMFVGDLAELRLEDRVPPFDIVTMHDVIEHFVDPFTELEAARRILAPGGLLVIDTPDPSSDDAQQQGIGWKHIRPREHIFLFSRYNYRSFLPELGFDILEIDEPIPGKMVLYCLRTEQ